MFYHNCLLNFLSGILKVNSELSFTVVPIFKNLTLGKSIQHFWNLMQHFWSNRKLGQLTPRVLLLFSFFTTLVLEQPTIAYNHHTMVPLICLSSAPRPSSGLFFLFLTLLTMLMFNFPITVSASLYFSLIFPVLFILECHSIK